MEKQLTFRPRARLLQLLGEQLIGSDRLAIFELVKNAYDADASEVSVTLKNLGTNEAAIIVRDNGEGMDLHTIENIWLEPGADHREKQRTAGVRTPTYQRLPLGEKGLGRFAVHKLGNQIELTTRRQNTKEYVVHINWSELTSKKYLDESNIRVTERAPLVFTGNESGTRIRITELRRSSWQRGDIRRLKRDITSICSPFVTVDRFKAVLKVPGHEEWLNDVLDLQDILSHAMWTFEFELRQGRLKWSYSFKPYASLGIEGRAISGENDVLLLSPSNRKRITADAAMQEGIGTVKGSLYVYDRDKEVLNLLSETKFLQDYLDDNGGIRVYRDGIRVYNYGERDDDWLGLDLRRVNAPDRRISRNLVLGGISITLKESVELREKTNREGFQENDAFERLRILTLGAFEKLEVERQDDKRRLRKLLSKPKGIPVDDIASPIDQLRSALKKQKLLDNFEPFIGKIETRYEEMKDLLLQTGMSGLNLALIFHEVERGVREMHHAIGRKEPMNSLVERSNRLTDLLEGFATLLRKDNKKVHSLRDLIKEAHFINKFRFINHSIQVISPILSDAKSDQTARFAFNILLGALNNAIDNAIYWLQVKWVDDDKGSPKRTLYIDVSDEFDGPAIVIGDNGPGLKDSAQEITRPFFTRKAGGMGLGLYYSSLAMEMNSGSLQFPNHLDLELPEQICGTVVAFVFRGEK